MPQHGYSFSVTPLWAGIYMLPLTVGFLIAGPLSGTLSDRFGARPFATGGMLLAALSFGLLEVLPVNFSYIYFALLLLLMGLAMGIFSAPNLAGIMNSLPPEQRGAGAGMLNTFQNSAQVLSIGVFFTLIILGLSRSLPQSLYAGLIAQGVPSGAAHAAAALPPVASLFAAFLGYNPIRTLLGPTIAHLPPDRVAYLTGRSFFPKLIAAPFESGLAEAFTFAVIACLIAAAASWLRGGMYHHSAAAVVQPATAQIPTQPDVLTLNGGTNEISNPSPDAANGHSVLEKDRQTGVREMAISSVVVGIDGTEASYHALSFAVGLAARERATVSACFVWHHQITPMGGVIPMDPEACSKDIAERVGEEFERVGVAGTFELREGEASGELKKLADERRADVIVVGRSRHPYLNLGSVPRHLLDVASHAVLIVP